MSSAFDELPRHDLKLLLGDLNAKVTSDCSSMLDVIGGHQADDMAMLDNSKEGLQETTDLLCKCSAYAGLKNNAGKTQSKAVNRNASQRLYSKDDTGDINVEGLPIQQVSSFTYLGAIISANGTIDKELTARIQKASGAFY